MYYLILIILFSDITAYIAVEISIFTFHCFMCKWSFYKYTHTHTHTHIYIYIYIKSDDGILSNPKMLHSIHLITAKCRCDWQPNFISFSVYENWISYTRLQLYTWRDDLSLKLEKKIRLRNVKFFKPIICHVLCLGNNI